MADRRVLYCLWLVVSLVPHQAQAQGAFIKATDRLPRVGFTGMWTKAVVDVDGNGLDDMVATEFPSGDLYITYQTQPGVFRAELVQTLAQLPISTVVGDVNRDNRNDLITGGNYDGITVHYNEGNGAFRSESITNPLILMQAANLTDVNNDGWLDYLGLNDVGLNQLWKNDKAGKLTAVSNWIDFVTVPPSDNSGNYGSVWSDIDNDGDLDLYVAKCSEAAMGAANAADPRRINQLFINNTYSRINGQVMKNPTDFSANPAGWFTEQAADYNVKISGQSWTADFADIDNDGDQDLLVTNHELETMLLENDGTGHFTDITPASQLTGLGKPLQGIMRDFDNDSYVDILIAGSTEIQLWHNNGNRTFTKRAGAFGQDITNSFAVGDLNHDGFYDVYASYNPNDKLPDELWLNPGNTNHFLAITLQGTQSNSNGVGAKITLYRANNTRQVREVRAGESYGITNTYTQIFGLGQTTAVTKVEVQWPSGLRSSLTAPSHDQFLTITEPRCTATCVPITTERIR